MQGEQDNFNARMVDEKVKEEVAATTLSDYKGNNEAAQKEKGKPVFKKWWFWVIVSLLIISIGSNNPPVEQVDEEIAKNETTSTLNQNNEDNAKIQSEAETEEVSTNENTVEDQEEVADVKADDYNYDSEEFEETVEDEGFNDFKEYTNTATIIEYKILSKNPDKYIGTRIEVTGRVLYIEESSVGLIGNKIETYIILGTDSELDYLEDYVVVTFDHEVEIYEDQLVTVWGEVIGRDTYASDGQEYYAPGVDGKYYHN